jgi:hypothetical protein
LLNKIEAAKKLVATTRAALDTAQAKLDDPLEQVNENKPLRPLKLLPIGVVSLNSVED